MCFGECEGASCQPYCKRAGHSFDLFLSTSQGRIQTLETFAQANVRFYGRKTVRCKRVDFTIFVKSIFLYKKQYTEFYFVDSISCSFLNLWIPSAIASYPVIKIVKQCSEGIPVVINYRETIISGAKFK